MAEFHCLVRYQRRRMITVESISFMLVPLMQEDKSHDIGKHTCHEQVSVVPLRLPNCSFHTAYTRRGAKLLRTTAISTPNTPPKSSPKKAMNFLFGLDFSSGTTAGSIVRNRYSGDTFASMTVFVCSSIRRKKNILQLRK